MVSADFGTEQFEGFGPYMIVPGQLGVAQPIPAIQLVGLHFRNQTVTVPDDPGAFGPQYPGDQFIVMVAVMKNLVVEAEDHFPRIDAKSPALRLNFRGGVAGNDDGIV